MSDFRDAKFGDIIAVDRFKDIYEPDSGKIRKLINDIESINDILKTLDESNCSFKIGGKDSIETYKEKLSSAMATSKRRLQNIIDARKDQAVNAQRLIADYNSCVEAYDTAKKEYDIACSMVENNKIAEEIIGKDGKFAGYNYYDNPKLVNDRNNKYLTLEGTKKTLRYKWRNFVSGSF